MGKDEKKVQNAKIPLFLKEPKILYTVLITGFSLFVLIIATCFINLLFGLILLFLYVVLIGTIYLSVQKIEEGTTAYISDLSYRIKRGEQDALIEMPIGIMLYNEQFELQWNNPYMQKYLGNQLVLGKKISDIDPELGEVIKNNSKESSEIKTVSWNGKKFQIIVQEEIRVVYLMDITYYANIAEVYQEQQIVIGNIFIDNYDEITQSMNDRKTSNLNSYVTTQLTSWAKEYQVYLKRVAEDRFICLMYAKSLEKIENSKFSIVDKIRERTSKQNFPLTLSIGIAYGDPDLSQLANVAQSNLDLALGRGGDQVVVKSVDGEARFYGGKTNPMEKRTRVRSRMISQALQELIKQSDEIFVMGHRYPDMDAIGSCLGIRRIAEMNGKKASIILKEDQLKNDVSRMMVEIEKDHGIHDAIITPEQASTMITADSLLIMVDFHKPSIAVAPEIVEQTKKIVIIDHHRRGEEFPKNPVLVYIEPYASSAAELITELFEYQPSDGAPINKIEATAMLAGMTVDTNSFSLRTGSRTFDAASYLRSVGADSVLIQRLLKENVDTYLLRSHLIETLTLYSDHMAIACGEEEKIYDSVVAAQTADTMLSMAAVEASFVITCRSDGKIGISARSLGEINVQVIMEKLGGGGHLSNAATQLENVTIEEAKKQLEKAIDEYVEGKS
ncbi:DHH family phosphoesterase [Isobaculum melis]|uniref:Cyclic-di-AMP phosphodiesterase n=1 Tax=Isobaculum melis TaxID=142588 RepID=A0A1H9TUY0_9LACT|nr:DHH family phosphoesterase [Isobaculum melis]SES00727.1 c-di-AMP phosphodiesterase, consists of a GGDEF-like and DHH domains [Isobaculum melis]